MTAHPCVETQAQSPGTDVEILCTHKNVNCYLAPAAQMTWVIITHNEPPTFSTLRVKRKQIYLHITTLHIAMQ